MTLFVNRGQAGEFLAHKLLTQLPAADCIFFLPKGGVEIAAAIAERFACPISPLLVAKIRHPLHPEIPVGAMDQDGEYFLSPQAELRPKALEYAIRQAALTLEHQKETMGKLIPSQGPPGGVLVLVDDGLATGHSSKAGLRYLRRKYHPDALVLAVPCASVTGLTHVNEDCDRVLTVEPPDPAFQSVGEYYRDFEPPNPEAVAEIVHRINERYSPKRASLRAL